MRIVLVSAALLALSACSGEPPPGGVMLPPGYADRAPVTPIAAAPPAPVVAEAGPAPAVRPAPVARARAVAVLRTAAVPKPAPGEPVPLAAAPPQGVALAPAAPPPVIAPQPPPPPPVVAATPAPPPPVVAAQPPLPPVIAQKPVPPPPPPAIAAKPAPPPPVIAAQPAPPPPPVIAAQPAPPPPVVAARPARLPVTAAAPLPLMPPPAAKPVPAVAVAAPPPQPAPAVVPAVFVPRWTAWLFGHPPAASPGRMTLSNFTVGLAHVEALITPYPDCVVRPGMVPIDIKLPLNGTWALTAPPGQDVCWRRKVERRPGAALAAVPPPGGWTPWNRVFTSFGHSVDAHL